MRARPILQTVEPRRTPDSQPRLSPASLRTEASPVDSLALLQGQRTPGGANPPQQAVMVWRELPVPVIAAVHGAAYGGGLQLMLAADLRLVAADARLSVMEIHWGLVPDMGGMVLLRGLVRDDVARELVYTGRVFDGAEALRLGLATRLCADPRAEARGQAGQTTPFGCGIAARPGLLTNVPPPRYGFRADPSRFSTSAEILCIEPAGWRAAT